MLDHPEGWPEKYNAAIWDYRLITLNNVDSKKRTYLQRCGYVSLRKRWWLLLIAFAVPYFFFISLGKAVLIPMYISLILMISYILLDSRRRHWDDSLDYLD